MRIPIDKAKNLSREIGQTVYKGTEVESRINELISNCTEDYICIPTPPDGTVDEIISLFYFFDSVGMLDNTYPQP